MASSFTSKNHQTSSNCGICDEPFRSPRRLRCHHCYCEECLEGWIDHNKETVTDTVCPVCKKTTPIPSEGVSGFPAFRMEKTKEDYAKKMCSKCKKSDGQRATHYCQDCKHYLCQACFDAHTSWERLKHHWVATIEDLILGRASLTDNKDRYCADHEGEKNKFYCKTCKKLVCRDCILMVQHCRDHDYVTLKVAAAERLGVIDEEMKKCDDRKKKCQDALEKIEAVATGLDQSADDAQAIYETVKIGYLHQLQEFFAAKEKDVISIQLTRKGELDCTEKDLQGQLKKLTNASEQGKSLKEAASHYDVVSNYDSVVDALQTANKAELKVVDETVVDIPITPIPPVIEFNQRWKLIGQFKVACTKSNEGPTGIAVTSGGKIALCDRWRRIMIVAKSGDIMYTIDGMMGGLGDVSVTSTNGYVVPTHGNCCKVYDNNCTLLSEFKTYGANNKPSEARAVTVDKNGCIILGMNDNAISIYNDDGSFKSSFALSFLPDSVAVTSHEEIVVGQSVIYVDNGTLQLYSYSGKCLQTLDSPKVTHWNPGYMCCSKRDEVFVVNRGDPKGIHKYAAGRVYMGCITTEVDDPWGIALSHDDQELYVAENREEVVKIFKTPC